MLQPDFHETHHGLSGLVEQIVAAFDPQQFECVSGFMHGKPTSGSSFKTAASRTKFFDLPDSAMKGLRLGAKWSLYRFLRAENFDVVICNRFKPVNMLMDLNRYLHIPVCIGISHGLGEYDTESRRYRFKRLLSPAWQFVGVSSAVRDYLLGLDCGFSHTNTTYINNAIDIDHTARELFERETARKYLAIPASARVIGTAGRLVPIKGHTFLVRAFAEIAPKHPDAHLAILGSGREETTLRNLVESLGLKDRIHLPGFVADAKRYIRAFDVWAMPSLSEGLSISLLEGMCGQLPVVASDIPAITPFVRQHGLLVPPEQVAPLADALDSYLSLPPEKLEAIGKAAFKYLQDNHDIRTFHEKYRRLVKNTLKKAGRPVPD